MNGTKAVLFLCRLDILLISVDEWIEESQCYNAATYQCLSPEWWFEVWTDWNQKRNIDIKISVKWETFDTEGCVSMRQTSFSSNITGKSKFHGLWMMTYDICAPLLDGVITLKMKEVHILTQPASVEFKGLKPFVWSQRPWWLYFLFPLLHYNGPCPQWLHTAQAHTEEHWRLQVLFCEVCLFEGKVWH